MIISAKRISAVLAVSLILALFGGFFSIAAMQSLPDSISVSEESQMHIESIPYVSIEADDDDAVAASASVGTGYRAQVKLLGIIPIKNIDVKVVDERQVVLCGTPFGIKIWTKGVVVIGTNRIDTLSGSVNPGEDAGICVGDIIECVNGVEVKTTDDLTKFIEKSQGSAVTLTIVREGKRSSVSLTPSYSQTDGVYRAGLWVRDSTAGIGILTYIDPGTGYFGGLGHAICDSSSGVVLPVGNGSICDVSLTGVQKGVSGTPGELTGFLGEKSLGRLIRNDETGVYGIYDMPYPTQDTVSVAMKQQVKKGRAQMLTTLPGKTEPELYDVEIEKINYDDNVPTRNMVIKVTDERLLDITGGIVQGMSGSPLIQDGKLIGAVTHVFVNDPTKGYGIFIENMLDEAG